MFQSRRPGDVVDPAIALQETHQELRGLLAIFDTFWDSHTTNPDLSNAPGLWREVQEALEHILVTYGNRIVNSRQHPLENQTSEEPRFAVNPDRVCVICCDREADTAITCGHVFCNTCTLRFFRCPMCREVVNIRLKIKLLHL